jgi:class 3 adenylate cyclase
MKKKRKTPEATETVSILFADVKGFSSLELTPLEIYAKRIVPLIAAMVDKYRSDLLEVNTWGDGFFILSHQPRPLAELALELRDFFRNTHWSEFILPQLAIRIALHSASVFLYRNLIPRRKPGPVITGCIGPQVNLAARIEPITPPNHIWTTGVFKDLLTGLGNHPSTDFKFEDIGSQPLPKGGGEINIYHLMRPLKDEPSPRPPIPITLLPLSDDTNPRYKSISDRLDKCVRGEEAKFIGITGKSALLPVTLSTTRRFDEHPVPKAIKKGVRIKAIFLEPKSHEARFRSAVEDGEGVPPGNRLLQSDARALADNLHDVYRRELRVPLSHLKTHLQVRRTSIGLGFSLWLFNDMALVEPFHFAKETGKPHLCGFALMFIPKGQREYDLLKGHFEKLWTAKETRLLL